MIAVQYVHALLIAMIVLGFAGLLEATVDEAFKP